MALDIDDMFQVTVSRRGVRTASRTSSRTASRTGVRTASRTAPGRKRRTASSTGVRMASRTWTFSCFSKKNGKMIFIDSFLVNFRRNVSGAGWL